MNLTAKQYRVWSIGYLSDGEIARILRVPRTRVSSTMQSLRLKFGAVSRTDLLIAGMECGHSINRKYLRRPEIVKLNMTERRVLRHITRMPRDIAAALNLAYKYVAGVIVSLKRKFGVKTRGELMVLALDGGYAELHPVPKPGQSSLCSGREELVPNVSIR